MKVIQCWDDGPVNDLRLIDILRRYQARATFCLNPGLYQDERSFGWLHDGQEVWRLSIHELPEVYEGFEICNHSMTHPDLTGLTGERLDWEIRASRELLEKIFQKPVRGFCYPFNAYDHSTLHAVRSAGHLWARCGQNGKHIFPPDDPLRFSPHCHFLDPEFRLKYEHAKKKEKIFFFWGHSYELTSEDMWVKFEGWIKETGSDETVEWSFIDDLFG